MAGTTARILGDQLSHANPVLEGADRVLLVESRAKLRSGRWHRQKLHLVLSANMPLRNLEGIDADELRDIRRRAREIRA